MDITTKRPPHAWHPTKGTVPTKYRYPWTLKPGDEICLFLFHSSQPSTVTVTRITRHVGTFTGATVFRLHYIREGSDAEQFVDCHGKLKSLPAEKILTPA